ncbi:MAG: extracellular solute-binding protein [Chloroflexi bacterium]|nr:extracellular solute-binding protein [Chloroflexota bacterium]
MKSIKLIVALSILLALLAGIPTGAQDPVTINLWTWTANKLEVYEGWIADYTAEFAPNVTIAINLIPRANYDQTLSAALIGGEIPDIWEALPLGEVKTFYENGLSLDLTPFVDEEWAAALYPSSLDYLTIDGQILSMSQATNNVQALYNKDRFEELGLEVPETMDELVDVVAALREAGYGAAAYWASANDHAPTLFFNWGQQLYPEAFHAADLDEADWQTDELIGLMEQISPYNEIWVEGVTALSLDEMNALFAEGDISIYFIGNWAVNAILGFEPEFEIGVFPVPGIGEGTRPAALGSMAGTWVASASSEHQDIVVDFIRWVTINGQDEAVKVVGLCPAGPAGEEAFPEANYVTQQLCAGQATAVPRDIFDRAARDAMAQVIQGVITGQAAPADVLRAADRAR